MGCQEQYEQIKEFQDDNFTGSSPRASFEL